MSILNINSLLNQRILRDRQTDDLDGVTIAGVEHHGRVLGIHGYEGAAVWIFVEALQGGVVVDADGGDLAVIHDGLAADEYNVTIMDVGAYHAVAAYDEPEVCVDASITWQKGFYMLIRQNRLSGGDLPDDGDHALFDGDNVFEGRNVAIFLFGFCAGNHRDVITH